MKSTERLGLALPEPSDYVNIETLNENFRRLDALTPSDINAAPQDHGAHVPAVQDADNAKFLRNDNTWKKVTPANIGAVPTTRTVNGKALSSDIILSAADVNAAATSHGNHVPTPQTANNATFLRNDNSWQKVTPANIGAAVTATYTATVTTSWTASGDYYYQDITVSGILATDTPIVDIVCGSDNAANKVYSENICKVFRITTSANKIRVWATEKISTAFPIQLKVVR
ncbi:MAG: hypothetical protein IKB79_05010 [Oscillospiraceae bacterium]|nr:hypothetical protein [Oscillospiraceae bacterium]